jgi:hypothetical protein
LNFASPEDVDRLIPSSMLDDSNWEDLVTLFKRVPIFKKIKEDNIQDLARGKSV